MPKLRILIVEDQIDSAETLAVALRLTKPVDFDMLRVELENLPPPQHRLSRSL